MEENVYFCARIAIVLSEMRSETRSRKAASKAAHAKADCGEARKKATPHEAGNGWERQPRHIEGVYLTLRLRRVGNLATQSISKS